MGYSILLFQWALLWTKQSDNYHDITGIYICFPYKVIRALTKHLTVCVHVLWINDMVLSTFWLKEWWWWWWWWWWTHNRATGMYHSTVMYLHVWLVENSATEVAVKGRFIQSPETNSRVCQKNKGTAVTLSDQSLLDSPFIFVLYMLMN